MPYTELYDYDKCARFVAQFIAYEPLDLPTSLPAILPSPATVMDWQAGDSFDCAQLLCSLLLGVGYDAYVVSGYAPKGSCPGRSEFGHLASTQTCASGAAC